MNNFYALKLIQIKSLHFLKKNKLNKIVTLKLYYENKIKNNLFKLILKHECTGKQKKIVFSDFIVSQIKVKKEKNNKDGRVAIIIMQESLQTGKS